MKLISAILAVGALILLIINAVKIMMAGMTTTLDTFIVGVTCLVVAAFVHKSN